MNDLPSIEQIRALMQHGQYAGALAAFQELERRGTNTPDIAYGKGICLAALGRTTEARAAVQRLKELGNVAMAQRLAQRITEEDPFPTDDALAPTPQMRRGDPPSSLLRYAAASAGAVLLVLIGIAIGMSITRNTPTDVALVRAPDRTVTDSSSAPSPAPARPSAATVAPAPAGPAAASLDLTGHWRSVDFVHDVDDFRPGTRATQVELFLAGLQCNADGSMALDSPWNAPFVWESGKIMDTPTGIAADYYIKEIGGDIYLFFPWLSGDVTERGQPPQYYVLQKVTGEMRSGAMTPAAARQPAAAKKGFRTVTTINAVHPYDDVRWKDMRSLDLTSNQNLPATLTFNNDSIWPSSLPPGFDPAALMLATKNPGLGVRQIHREGITGKGVNVGIIDQPLFDDHPEFLGKIAEYHDVGCESESSMHGPAVASLLVGSTCGAAPDAKLYYVAAPSWKRDAAYYANALSWLVHRNQQLATNQKIRVVSVSAAPSIFANGTQWDEACAVAESQGMLVLDCTDHRGIIGPSYYDIHAPDDVTRCLAGFPGMPGVSGSNRLLVPASPRTTAEEYERGECEFQYTGRGGLSWSIPYCAGVLALGWQIRPGLTKEQMVDLLFRSAYEDRDHNRFVNPPKFIEMVKSATANASSIPIRLH